MKPWTFLEYVTEEPRCRIQDWYGTLDVDVQAVFDQIKLQLAGIDNWLEPEIIEFRLLTERHAPLAEMRFRADRLNAKGAVIEKRRYRPVGFYRPEQEYRDFIFFGGAQKTEGGLSYIPENAFDDALADYHNFLVGKGGLREHF